VLKLLSETYIFSVVFVINCSWRKTYFFYLWKPALADPTIVLTWQKSNDSIPGLPCSHKLKNTYRLRCYSRFRRKLSYAPYESSAINS